MKDQYKKELSISSNITQLTEDYFNLKFFFRNDNESTLLGMATSLCLNTKKEFIEIIEQIFFFGKRFIKILVTLISDENFICTIKRFSDEDSLENIQKIFDYIFVRRFYKIYRIIQNKQLIIYITNQKKKSLIEYLLLFQMV
jgi:hypothetical protein